MTSLREKPDLTMSSLITEKFRRAYAALPPDVQGRTRKAYRLWRENSAHPSLHFKKIGKIWSVRIDQNHRALAHVSGGSIYWFWIGPHAEYELYLAKYR